VSWSTTCSRSSATRNRPTWCEAEGAARRPLRVGVAMTAKRNGLRRRYYEQGAIFKRVPRRAYWPIRPRSSVDRAADFESACASSILAGAIRHKPCWGGFLLKMSGKRVSLAPAVVMGGRGRRGRGGVNSLLPRAVDPRADESTGRRSCRCCWEETISSLPSRSRITHDQMPVRGSEVCCGPPRS